MQEVAGYEITINDLFNSPPKTENVHNDNFNSSAGYDYISFERNDQEGIYENVDEFSKPKEFSKKYCCIFLAVLALAILVAVSIILLLVLPKHSHRTVWATTSRTASYSTSTFTTTKIPITTTIETSRTAPDSTHTSTTTKIPITTTTQIFTQTSEKTSRNFEETTVARTTVASSTSIKTTYTTAQFPTTTSTSDTSCNSTTFPSTFLFAYSNDLLSETVLDTFNKFSSYLKHYSWFGSVRFDIETIDIQFHKGDANPTIANNLPDPNQGFQNSKIGSNVFDVIEKFFSNTQAPVCGSIICILLKRYPNESDISRLVSLIRYHHAIVHVMTSATPSGGSQSKAMYSVASKTNGMGMVEYDENFPDAIDWLPLFNAPYPIYAATIQVSGSGTKTFPDFYSPSARMYWVGITYQDHVPIDSFQYLKFCLTNHQGNASVSVSSRDVSYWDDGNYLGQPSWLINVDYRVTLDYNYLGGDMQHLQFRIYTITPNSNWLPYSD
ncbi:hypothetical protein L3Y34_010956 [Caenorhabditis briggsae]|uniref:DUF7154 domain-containing protein n=1 Tax=Caenorhabditis briggsae TaxID=6238 RepID=A0AAE8ZT45_CAEBR|nr:hypothetical protein L3Y34_010956 [Caenorhabditis briggsae]